LISAEQLGLVELPTYTVWLALTGESDEEFYQRHPGARNQRHKAIKLSFGAGPTMHPKWPEQLMRQDRPMNVARILCNQMGAAKTYSCSKYITAVVCLR
jgi:hypothetical protein